MSKQFLFVLYIFVMQFSFAQNASHLCAEHKKHQFHIIQNNSNRDLTEQANYDVKFVRLNLNVTNTSKYISGDCTHLVAVKANNISQFVFELHPDLSISAATINGVTANFQRTGNELVVSSNVEFSLNELVSINIAYSGTPPNGNAFGSETGLFNDFSPTWGEQVTWTLSEPYSARTWWPSKQDLTDKIDSTELIFTVNNDLKVGANGVLVSEIAAPNNKKIFTWKSHYPIDYYLISFAVAPYQDYSYKIALNGTADSLLIQNFIYNVPGYLTNFEDDILETGEMVQLFSDKYGLYPFHQEKYGHCIAPLGGGMEHQTMTTQGYFLNWLTAHELGHQWWGDNVTCKTWNDIWINEGFASYSEYIYFQNQSQNAADNDMQARHDNIMTLPDGSVYVYDVTNSDRIFDARLSYDKGAAVVHMLRNMINDDDLFFETLKVIQDTYAFGNCSTDELKYTILQQTGIDLTQFMNAWIYGEGYPTYSGRYNTLNDTLFIEVVQQSSFVANSVAFPSGLELLVYFTDGTDTLLRLDNSDFTQGYYFLINKTVGNIVVDPNNWIINKTSSFVSDENYHFYVFQSITEDTFFENLSVNNPFSDELSLFLENVRKANFSIVNSEGKLIYEHVLKPNTKMKLKTMHWAKGIYFLNLKIDNKNYSKKLLKI